MRKIWTELFFNNQNRVYYLDHLFYSALKSKYPDEFKYMPRGHPIRIVKCSEASYISISCLCKVAMHLLNLIRKLRSQPHYS